MKIVKAVVDHQHQKPCDECAFMRNCERGLLGGSSPETYIGQAEAGFRIPCHCRYPEIAPGDPDWKSKVIDAPQCVGYAIFRANLGLPDRPGIHKAKPSPDAFASYAEFYAYHTGDTVEQAMEYLQWCPPWLCAIRELGKQDAKEYRLK
jgi:hypothetical protein